MEENGAVRGEIIHEDDEDDVVKIMIKGGAAKAVKMLARITGKQDPVDAVIAALRIYEWILARQVKGCRVVADSPDESLVESYELVNLVKDRELALQFFDGRDIFLG